jgi:hypothetical protein
METSICSTYSLIQTSPESPVFHADQRYQGPGGMMIDTPEKESILIRHLSWHRFRMPDSCLFPLVSRIHGNVPTEFHFGLSQ